MVYILSFLSLSFIPLLSTPTLSCISIIHIGNSQLKCFFAIPHHDDCGYVDMCEKGWGGKRGKRGMIYSRHSRSFFSLFNDLIHDLSIPPFPTSSHFPSRCSLPVFNVLFFRRKGGGCSIHTHRLKVGRLWRLYTRERWGGFTSVPCGAEAPCAQYWPKRMLFYHWNEDLRK